MKPALILSLGATAIVFAVAGYIVGQDGDEPAATSAPAPSPVAVTAEVASSPSGEETALSHPDGVDPELTVRPIEDVVAGGMPRIVDITHRDAVLVFRSSLPLACSVVYGPDEAFGKIATDQDMAGAAIVDHDPLLAGLEPDTDYFYRVQGVAADGTVYVGETGMFRTLPEPVATAPDPGVPVNLARLDEGMNVLAVSSNYGGAGNDEAWGVYKAFDGDTRSAWSSNGDGDDAWLEIDFGGRAHVTAVELWSRTMSDGTAQIYSFTLTGDDGAVRGPFVVPDVHQSHRFDVDLETATLRFDVEASSGGNTGLVEFVVLGSRR